MSPVYGSDLEFYSPNSTNGRGWKESSNVAGNNNNISSDAESGFSINVSTGNNNFHFIDENGNFPTFCKVYNFFCNFASVHLIFSAVVQLKKIRLRGVGDDGC